MAIEVNTKVSITEPYGKGAGNLVLEGARFFGRPNFSGEMDQFGNDDRQFTVLIPEDVSDQLRGLGWNVKTTIPRTAEEEPLSHLKVKVDIKINPEHPNDPSREKGPDIWVIMGESREKLTSRTVGLLDRARIENLDMEIRGWEYDPESKPGELSARLVTLVAVMRPSLLDQKYGNLI